MNAPQFLELPLGGALSSSTAVGQHESASIPPEPIDLPSRGGTTLGPQYLRLFGLIPPDMVMTMASPPAPHCDPTADGEAAFSSPALTAIAALRARHIAKGHTPATDAAHGPVFFWNGTHEFFRKALGARDPDKRRKRLIAGAAMLVALIDAEDFTRSQQEAAGHE